MKAKDKHGSYYDLQEQKVQISLILASIRACAKAKDLYRGSKIHANLCKVGLLKKSSHLANAIINMYAKCGALTRAKEFLGRVSCRNVVSWNALIAGYVQHGKSWEALDSFERMQDEGIFPDSVTFACILKVCASVRAIEKGEQIHDEVDRQGLLKNDIVLGTALVDMYVKCGALATARRVLQELPARNVVSWNAIIAGYAQTGQGHNALICLELMKREGLSPNTVTYVCILKACGSIGAAAKGERVHNEIARQGLVGTSLRLDTTLVDMYAKSGALTKAARVFKEVPTRETVSWNALITAYMQHGQGREALKCLEGMEREGLSPDAATFACILKSCGSTGDIGKGKQIHDIITRQGLLKTNVVLGSALVEMYAMWGSYATAQGVLEELPHQDVVAWNTLIAEYARQKQHHEALNCLKLMQDKGLSPDTVTYICILKVCGSIGARDKGEAFHRDIDRHGLLGEGGVLGTTLVDMYARCGAFTKAVQVFEDLPNCSIVAWNGLIAAYAQQGQDAEAWNCFERMQGEGIPPDPTTFSCILTACGSMGAVDKGEGIHDVIALQGLLERDVVLANAVVDMYAKCGVIAKAHSVLEKLPMQNTATWNGLIGGYAQQGQSHDAFNCLELMQSKGLAPDEVTFCCVLHACSHAGLVDEGQLYFANIRRAYGTEPNLEHHACMVDVYGRAGRIDKAIAVIEKMPLSDCSKAWPALLGACWKWGDSHIGKWAYEHVTQLYRSNGAAYVLMSNIYAVIGIQEDVLKA